MTLGEVHYWMSAEDSVTQTLGFPAVDVDQALAGKTAIVSGAGSDGRLAGIGAATAILLAASGANVVVLDVAEARAEIVRDLIQANGRTALAITADVTEPEACASAVRSAIDTYGSVDILVNSAAILPDSNPDNDNVETWHRVLDVNVVGAATLMRAAYEPMRRQGRGAIVNVSSIAATRGIGPASYAASKGAMVAMSLAYAARYGRSGVRVNCVAPGHVYAPMSAHVRDVAADRTGRRDGTLLGSEGTAWDVAAAVKFLAGSESRWITGALLPVDAGSTATVPLVLA